MHPHRITAVVGREYMLPIAMLEQVVLRVHLDEVPKGVDVGMIDQIDHDPVNTNALPRLDSEEPAEDVEEYDWVQGATDRDHLVCDDRVEKFEEGWQVANSVHWFPGEGGSRCNSRRAEHGMYFRYCQYDTIEVGKR